MQVPAYRAFEICPEIQYPSSIVVESVFQTGVIETLAAVVAEELHRLVAEPACGDIDPDLGEDAAGIE